MNYLITGGEFNNKGAEAMLLVAVSNILKYDASATIYLWERNTKKTYDFLANVILLECSPQLISIFSKTASLKTIIKEIVKFFLPKKKSAFREIKKVRSILKTVDVMIDISGFRLSSKWDDTYSSNYCDWIAAMKKFGAHIFLMPQSFGPFNYDDDLMLKRILKELPKCDIIYAREREGFSLLKSIGLTNVVRSCDSVLLYKTMDLSCIIKNYLKYVENINVSAEKNIAIIPNSRLVDRGGYKYEELLDFYTFVIKEYSNVDFYLTAHAGEDLKICKDIKERFLYDDRIHYIDHVLYPFNFQRFVKKMNFIIASRYHSIIHAYKECIPSVILGWSDKYNDLAVCFEQNDYLIDLKQTRLAMQKIKRMIDRYALESDTIKKRLDDIQMEDCYSFLGELNGNK